MARGKFNKRGGGKRVDAISAAEIEQRNQRLAEFEENRAKRRAEAEEEEAQDGDAGEEKEEKKSGQKGDAGKDSNEPVHVTSQEQHNKNLAKLEEVKKRRALAEERRKAQEEIELAAEMERKAKFKEQEAEAGGDDGKKKKKKSKEMDIPKLSKIEIKKMKPAQMKEALKERGLAIQGNKNELTKRLVEYEESR